MAGLYFISFAVIMISLVVWLILHYRKIKSDWLFGPLIIGLLVYSFTVFGASSELSSKLWFIFRDFVALGLVALVFNIVKKNLIISALLFLGLLFGLKTVYSLGLFKLISPDRITLNDEYEFLVELKEGMKPGDLGKELFDFEPSISFAFKPTDKDFTKLDNYLAVGIPDQFEENISKIQEILEADPSVVWVEGNEDISLNDPKSSNDILELKHNFGFNDPGIAKQWAFDKLDYTNLAQMLESGQLKPRKQALLVIVDTGVDSDHEDLKDNYLSIDEISDKDPRGHGTHCAGIAAAVSNNGLGIASVNPGISFVRVSSVKVLNSNGVGSQKKIIEGIIKAADAGADVISMSLGGRSTQSKQKTYDQAVSYANDKGAIVIVAAGNNGGNAKEIAPASAKGVITVTAIDNELNKATFSNHIRDIQMGISAPGVNIYSTLPGDKYDSLNGTSMATPHVSGLVALMKSVKPNLNTTEAYEILKRTGVNTNHTEETGKLIQVDKAIKAVLGE